MVHTREPHRVTRALKLWNASRKTQGAEIRPYYEWNFRDGWADYGTNMTGKPKVDRAMADPNRALRRINDVDGDGKSAWQGLFVMEFFHYAIDAKIPSLIQCLKLYCQEFSTAPKRLVLIVPDGFKLPRELENDIPGIDLDLPSKNDLMAIHDNIIRSSYDEATPDNKVKSPWSGDALEEILALGAGMTETEFATALSKVVATHRNIFPKITLEQAKVIMAEAKTEVIKRTNVLELMKSGDVSEIGGLDIYKSWLTTRKKAFSPDAQRAGVDTPKGALLIGPPGTGKSLCAKATAGLFGLPLVEWNIGRMMNSLVGQSEAQTRSALAVLEKMAPVVVFFDEVDKMGIDPRQGSGDSGVGKRILQSILTFMQESKAPVFWVVTANRADSIPSEFMRRGRLDEIFAILPPTKKERLEIIKIHLKRRGKSPDINGLEQAVSASEGYVSAELEAAVKDAILEAYSTGKELTGALIAEQIGLIKPLSQSMPDDFNRMRSWAELNARPTSQPDSIPPKRGKVDDAGASERKNAF